jgi:hypothetical protein
MSVKQVLVLALFSLSGCAAPGIFWQETPWEGPLILGNERARVLQKCDLGPSGISDVRACRFAFVDHQHKKIDASEDVQKLLDDYMPQVAPLSPWVKVGQTVNAWRAPNGQKLPYQLHILTISPVVVLAVPTVAGDKVDCPGRAWVDQGCIPSRRFDLQTYRYKQTPRRVAGTFWFSPELNVTAATLSPDDSEFVISLRDSKLRLVPNGDFWGIRREPNPK